MRSCGYITVGKDVRCVEEVFRSAQINGLPVLLDGDVFDNYLPGVGQWFTSCVVCVDCFGSRRLSYVHESCWQIRTIIRCRQIGQLFSVEMCLQFAFLLAGYLVAGGDSIS